MEYAKARHILVEDEKKCLEIKNNIENGSESFEDAAKSYSKCPSGKEGGDLGEFGKGRMVPEFDKAVFSGTEGEILGPVETEFGYHLIRVDELRSA
ncbi:MAG: peptidylprolyl isomerase [Fibrobacterota bacterium]